MTEPAPTPLQKEQLRTIAQARMSYAIDGAGFVQYGGTVWHYLGPGHTAIGGRWLQWDTTQAVLYSPYMGIVVTAPMTEIFVPVAGQQPIS